LSEGCEKSNTAKNLNRAVNRWQKRKNGKSEEEKGVTMNIVIKTLSHLLLVCLALSLMLGCTSPTTPPPSDTSSGPADRVEVVYFHRAQRCYSCIHAEEGIRYTVETYFADELASGKVTFEVRSM